MRIGAFLLALGLASLYAAARWQGAAWLLLWPGVAFLAVAAGYFGVGARVLGKGADGRLPWWSLVLCGPYRALAWLAWAALRRMGDAGCNSVAPGLYVGRRAPPEEIPADVTLVVDLTAELSGLPGRARYRCVPTLDGSVPPEPALRALVDEVAAADGPVYVGCAAGHGRSALVAALAMVRRGLASDADEAVALLQRARPRVRLARRQLRLARRLCAAAPGAGEPTPIVGSPPDGGLI